jgi:aspartate aminotransferase-like enzyme
MNMTASPVDPEGLMEFSVVFTDRSLNHMSKAFQGVMTDLYAMLCEVYHADAAVIVPGGGTFGMEAVARQFATDNKVMVIRNGWFSYRWTQIFEMGDIPSETTVIKASQVGNETTSAFAPEAIEVIAARIREERPGVVFAPHVETSQASSCPMNTSRRSPTLPMMSAPCSCSIASPRAASGSTCKPPASMC